MISVALSKEVPALPIMKEIELRLLDVASHQDNTFGKLTAAMIQAGGKRLRPLLVVLAAGETPPVPEAVIDVAVAAELLHTATLIHDDILDSAGRRRGIPTINALQGNHTAVLAGDYLFVTAITLLANKETAVALPVMTAAIQSLCEGEMDETNALYNTNTTEADYLRHIEKKTASLLAACCAAGALISGADPLVVTALESFGRNLGLSFQIIDDLLDFTGEEQLLGKPAGSDITQGVITLPVIHLLQDPRYRQRLTGIIRDRDCCGQNLVYINNAVLETDALAYTRNRGLHFAHLAVASLAALPSSALRQSLITLSEMLISRVS